MKKIHLIQTFRNCDKTVFENGVARLEVTGRELRKILADDEILDIKITFKKAMKQLASFNNPSV